MSGTIEPVGPDLPEGGGAGGRKAQGQIDPALIPGVAEHARPGVSASTKAVLTVMGLLIVSILLFVLWRIIFRPLRVEIPKTSAPEVASTSGAAKKLETPPSTPAAGRAGDDEPLPAVPAIAGESDPIRLRGTGTNAGRATSGAAPAVATSGKSSEDAPVLLARPGWAAGTAGAVAPAAGGARDELAATRSDLAEYRHQLGRSLETLQLMIPGGTGQAAAHPGAAVAVGIPAGSLAAAQPPAGGTRGVLGMQASEMPPARAGVLGNRSLVLPQGTSLTCALTTRVVSAQSGFVGCQVLRNVYGADGRVLLIERGSHLTGEYRLTQVRPGSTRIPALWTRLRTPGGITVDLDSPATGPLGESGADAAVDNRWFERVGAAMLVSVLDDSIKIVLNNETAPQQGGSPVVFQGTSQTASQMAEKVLDATVNLPPLLYANQGAVVGVYVARDVDFSSVYELQPVAR